MRHFLGKESKRFPNTINILLFLQTLKASSNSGVHMIGYLFLSWLANGILQWSFKFRVMWNKPSVKIEHSKETSKLLSCFYKWRVLNCLDTFDWSSNTISRNDITKKNNFWYSKNAFLHVDNQSIF